ncbi:MAG: response regulator [Chitinophagaceae bacterium]|nr:response regulator [Chitinophagaceae bacterium]
MKPRFSYFFWLLFLAFSLMILVVAAQVLTKRNINGLKSGNRDAVITFTINNKLQELVNLSFELNSKITGRSSLPQKRQSLIDSLTMLGYNAAVFESMTLNSDTDSAFRKLNGYVSMQVEASLKIFNNSVAFVNDGIDSLRKLRITDSIYFIALNIQKALESDLQKTLSSNNKVSDSLSDYNRTLAFIAIAAVFIFSAIIINRNLKQIQLISDLEVATKAARENARVKDQFLANMSHEIRTPLNAIKGFGRLLSSTSLNKEQQQYSSIINDATNNLINIVNDILDISKIEAGKLRIEKKSFNIKRVLQAVKHLFKNAASEKRIELTYEIEENVPLLLSGDPERLSQILINLVSNSIKFTSSGFVRIILSVGRIDNEKTILEFKIQDSGIGIPKDKLDVIFGRFEQLEAGKELLTKGTGLGLSIVKSLVSLMDGTISVTSDIGKGACFVVTLPFEKGEEDIEEPATHIAAEFQLTKKYPGSTVLLVEDNRVNQVLIRHLLQEYDIKAEVVSNGKEAIDAILIHDYDLILMDIQMPVMDGYSSVKIIRNEIKNSQPIIAMTAYALPGEKEKIRYDPF